VDGKSPMNQIINYEAEFCGKVPLNQTNMIQPHGVLLIVSSDQFQIIQVSENASEVLGLNYKEVISRSLPDLIPSSQGEKFKERFQQKFTGKLPFSFSFTSGDHLASIQSMDSFLIVEIEKEKRSPASNDSFLDMYQEMKYAMAAVEAAGTTEAACAVAIEELKRISGFDKIMVYRFDEEWNGDVIAEVKQDGMESYFGLKFPASDIPRQARELYRKMPYRLIPNVDYEPVKLYPVINPVTNAFTDLSNSELRSVAGVHLEYLRNMGVVASMSTRILMDGALWGLIACHHRQPKYLSFELCSAFELLSNVISAKISSVQKQDVFSLKSKKQDLYTEILEDMYRRRDLSASFLNMQNEWLQLLGSKGVSLINEHRVNSVGEVPDESDIAELVLWLQARNFNRVYHNPSLSSSFEGSEKYAKIASGILALPIQPERGSYILAFRPEVLQQVNWGGNPNEAVQFEPGGKQYHPRNSFSQWQQVVKGTSIPWKTEEIEIAESFRNLVVEYTLSKVYN
jgi:chemotaxis family two-component system sensor kinase Cph1